MKQILLVLMVLFSLESAQAQMLVKVIDGETLEPIPYATVRSNSPEKNFGVNTNIEGEANLMAFKNYNGEIIISSLGYESVKTTIENLAKIDFVVSLKMTNLALDQVVVSATRYAQPKSNTPMKISSISAKEIAISNPQTAADLLTISGDVFMQKSQQGGGSPMIRGFATNRLLITVDGVRMNTAIFRSGNVQNIISIDPFAIKNTEILFGPNSVIYGSDAIGGVMSFYTLDPQLYFTKSNQPKVKGNALTRYSSASNEYTGHFDVGIGWKKFGVLLSASHTTFGDLKIGKHGPDDYLRTFYVKTENNQDFVIENHNPETQIPSAYSQNNLMTKLLYKPNSLWDFTYGFHYSKTSEYARYDRLLVMKDSLPKSAEWNYGPQLWIMNNLKVHNVANNDLFDEFTLRFGQQNFEESRIDRSFNDTNRRTRTEKVLALSLNADFVKSIGSKNTFFYGTEFVYNDVNSAGESQNIFTEEIEEESARYPQSKWYSYAVYLTYQRKLNEKLLLHAGARYNYFVLDADFTNNLAFYPLPFETSNTQNGALTGSMGIDYNPSRNWSISTNFSTGFRSPNVDDIGKIFDSEPGNVVVPNPDLKAEYAYNVEVDVAKVFGNFLKIDVAVFYTYLQDALVRRTVEGADSIEYDGILSQVQSVQNATKAYVYGAELGLEIEFPGGFSLSSRYNFQKGIEENDDGEEIPLRHSAPQFGLTKLTYKYHSFKAEFYAVYSGEMSYKNLTPSERDKDYLYAKDENGNPYSPSWYTLNIKALYRVNKYLEFTTGLENITNQRYRPYSSGLSSPGINFIIAVKGSF